MELLYRRHMALEVICRGPRWGEEYFSQQNQEAKKSLKKKKSGITISAPGLPSQEPGLGLPALFLYIIFSLVQVGKTQFCLGFFAYQINMFSFPGIGSRTQPIYGSHQDGPTSNAYLYHFMYKLEHTWEAQLEQRMDTIFSFIFISSYAGLLDLFPILRLEFTFFCILLEGSILRCRTIMSCVDEGKALLGFFHTDADLQEPGSFLFVSTNDFFCLIRVLGIHVIFA